MAHLPQLDIARAGHAQAIERARLAGIPARKAKALRQARVWRVLLAAYLAHAKEQAA